MTSSCHVEDGPPCLDSAVLTNSHGEGYTYRKLVLVHHLQLWNVHKYWLGCSPEPGSELGLLGTG